MTKTRLVWVLTALGSLGIAACLAPAPQKDPTAFVPQRVEMPAQPESDSDSDSDPQAALAVDAAPAPAPVAVAATSDAGTTAREPLPPIPVSWSFTYGHTKPWAEAIRIARAQRASFNASATSITGAVDGGTPNPKEVEKSLSLIDLASRQYAAAYHASNASAENKIDALREASQMILAWSRRLDEAGLARAPATYRSDPSVALTFEDVANGPAKRWREDGLALVNLCVESAKTNRVDTEAARDCTAMRKTYTRVIAPPPSSSAAAVANNSGKDAGISATGCACDPGDPLCSASMSGWCRPK